MFAPNPAGARRLGSRVLLIVCLIALTACGGAEADDGTGGVASISVASEGADAAEADPEEALLEWVECMRGEGVDIADPTVDADGNLTLGGRPGGGAGGGGGGGGEGGGGGGQGDAGANAEAREVCGTPPLTGGGFGFAEGDQTAFQDAALAMAQCMRDAGFDVADPQFGEGGAPGGGAPGGGGPGADGGGRAAGGIFGDLDLEEPGAQEAYEACQEQAFADAGLEGMPGPGGGGFPGAGGGR